jgi:hypothetical protein
MGSPDLDEDGNIIIGNIISLAHQNVLQDARNIKVKAWYEAVHEAEGLEKREGGEVEGSA